MSDNYDVPYMERTRDFYRAQGYESDYQWARHDHTPFQSISKALSESRLALITTSMPDTPDGRSHRAVYSTPVDPIPESLYTAELSWHHGITHTDDVGSFLPINQINKKVAEGKVGNLAPEFYSLPTEYSQRNTLHKDGPGILRKCQDSNVDLAILIPL